MKVRFLVIAVFLMMGACSSSSPKSTCWKDSTPLLETKGADSNREGILYDQSGNALAETPVRLLTVDDSGTESVELETTVTDGNGHFQFSLTEETNASVLVEATVGEGILRGFWAGHLHAVPVHPITQALVTILFDLTSSGIRSTSDFSAEELRILTQKAFDITTGVDITDAASLETFLRKNLGRILAQAAGGEICPQAAAALDDSASLSDISFAPDVTACPIGYDVHIFSTSAFQFDLRPDGSVCGGTGGGLPAMLAPNSIQLDMLGDSFFAGGSILPDAGMIFLEGDREVSYGPYSLLIPPAHEGDPVTEDTLQVSRKVFIPASGDYARYLEIFSNSGAADRTISFKVVSTLLTGNSSLVLTDDPVEEGLGISDRFLAVYDSNQDRPTVGFVIQDGLGISPLSLLYAPGLAGGNINEVQYRWINVTIPAGTTLTWLHYVFVTTARFPADVNKALVTLSEQPDMSGMSRQELAGLMNFTPSRGTLEGTAGSVVGYAEITGENLTSGNSLTVKARRDGSFAIPLDTVSGDEVHVTASDGLDTTLTVP